MSVDPGRSAYEGYAYRSRGTSPVSGAGLLEWGDLPEKIQKSWGVVADASLAEADKRAAERSADAAELQFDAAHEKG